MLEVLSDAVHALGRGEDDVVGEDLDARKSRLQKQLDELLRAEEEAYKLIKPADALAAPSNWLKKESAEGTNAIFNITSFFRTPSLCHTPLMPSDSRLRGILADEIVPYGEGYERAVAIKKVRLIEKPARAKEGAKSFDDSDQLMIAADGMARGGSCPEPGIETTNENSLRDFFLVTSMQGWRGLTLPNVAEQEQFRDFGDSSQREGWIILCFLRCLDKKQCTENMILSNTPTSDNTEIEMQVNGMPVSGYSKYMSNPGNCRALQHEDEDPKKEFVWTPNEDGKYDIRIRIKDLKKPLWSQLKITAFILM